MRDRRVEEKIDEGGGIHAGCYIQEELKIISLGLVCVLWP